MYFQILLFSNFRKMTTQLRETLLLLSTGHLFGLYNPNQVADALTIPKATLYRQSERLQPLSVEMSIGAYRMCLLRYRRSGMPKQKVLLHNLVVVSQSVWMIQMIRAMVNCCPTATSGGLKNIITQSDAEMC